MRAAIILGCAFFVGCATPPENVEHGDVIPINAAPAPSELKVEHHRFKDDVIPGAYVDRSGYTPTILISDPAKRSSEHDAQQTGLADRSKSAQSDNKDVGNHAKQAFGSSSSDSGKVAELSSDRCPTSEKECVLAELFFGLDQAELTNVGHAILDSLDVSGKSLELIGYADAVGEKGYNGKLALARANSVREVLLAAGASEVVIRAGHEAKFSGPKFRKVIIVGL